jgi:peptide deformylase
MAVRKILQVGNDLLYLRSKPVDPKSGETEGLLRDLRDTLEDFMERKKLGRGISCPQIGILKQAIYVIEDGEHMSFVNPRIVRRSPEKMMVWDSCFCYDLDIFVLIERDRDIELEYCTPDGDFRRAAFSGPLSELLQHETDHLNGILSYQRLEGPKSIMKRSEWEAHGSPYIVDGWK